jgi:hypothetical protein
MSSVKTAGIVFLVVFLATLLSQSKTKNIDISINQSGYENCVTTVSSGKGINSNSVKIYPNPAKGKIVITFNGFKNNSVAKLKISDIVGNTVFEKQLSIESSDKYSIQIDLSYLSRGQYVVYICNNSNFFATKLIFE